MRSFKPQFKILVGSLIFISLYGGAVAFAVTYVTPGSTLDPAGGPGSYSVRMFPDQTGNSGKFLTTDGTDVSWATTPDNGLISLNGLTGATQTFDVGSSGTDFNISSSGTIHTFNIPTASATNRGLVSTTDWSAFNSKFDLPSLTSGSILFSNGTTIAQDNSNLFWDDSTNTLGIGTATTTFSGYDPKLFVQGSGTDVGGRTTFILKNTSPDSGANISLVNSDGDFFGTQVTGPSYFSVGAAASFGTSNLDMLFSTDFYNAYTGGTHIMKFQTGGFENDPTMVITAGNPGRVVIGGLTTASYPLHVRTTSTSADVIGITNGTETMTLGVNNAAGGSFLYENSNSALRFGTNSTERARISSTGFLGINDTSPDYRLDVETDVASYVANFFNDGNATTRSGILIQAGLDNQASAGPSTLVGFADGDGTAVGSITFGTSATAYNTSSDRRLKENIVDTALSIDLLKQIKIRDFTWIADSEHKLAHGVIAQELYDVYPGAVARPIDETTSTWMVDYSKLVPLAIKSIQDLDLKIKSIEDLTTNGNTFINIIKTWLESAGNGVQKIFTHEIHTDQVCVKKSDGSEICVNGDQLNTLLGGGNFGGSTSSSGTTSGSGDSGTTTGSETTTDTTGGTTDTGTTTVSETTTDTTGGTTDTGTTGDTSTTSGGSGEVSTGTTEGGTIGGDTTGTSDTGGTTE